MSFYLNSFLLEIFFWKNCFHMGIKVVLVCLFVTFVTLSTEYNIFIFCCFFMFLTHLVLSYNYLVPDFF
jgi:hypothetical protein